MHNFAEAEGRSPVIATRNAGPRQGPARLANPAIDSLAMMVTIADGGNPGTTERPVPAFNPDFPTDMWDHGRVGITVHVKRRPRHRKRQRASGEQLLLRRSGK